MLQESRRQGLRVLAESDSVLEQTDFESLLSGMENPRYKPGAYYARTDKQKLLDYAKSPALNEAAFTRIYNLAQKKAWVSELVMASLASNPAMPLALAWHFAIQYPQQFLANPVLPLLGLEDPTWVNKLGDRGINNLMLAARPLQRDVAIFGQPEVFTFEAIRKETNDYRRSVGSWPVQQSQTEDYPIKLFLYPTGPVRALWGQNRGVQGGEQVYKDAGTFLNVTTRSIRPQKMQDFLNASDQRWHNRSFEDD